MPLFPTQNKNINELIKEYNYFIAQECFETEIEFLDIYDLLLDENDILKPNYTDDGFELNQNAYNLIANQISELINILENQNYYK